MKLKINSTIILLIFIFILTLAFRLYFTFQTDNLNGDDAYFHLRHIESITKFDFVYYDDLSYGGRYIIYPPIFHLVMAVLTFGNLFLLKLIPEILLASVVFIVFLLSKEITKNDNVSLISALFSGFVPLFLVETVNGLSVYSFVIPLILLAIYSFMDLNKRIRLFLFAVSLLALVHLSAFLVIISLGFYFLLLAGENIKLDRLEKEVILFTLIIIFLFSFIIYKKAFLEYGIGIISQGIPSNLASDYFRDINILDLIIGVGILPLIFGSYGVFSGVREKNKGLHLINGFIFSIFLLLVFRLIEFYIGIMFLGIFLAITSSIGLLRLANYVENTKIAKVKLLFSSALIILVAVLMIMPVSGLLNKKGFIHDQSIHDFEWIKENSKEDSVVLGLLNEGHLINSLANRINVIDDNFLLAKDPVKRLENVNLIYSTGSEAIALDLIHKYNIKYIYFSDDAKRIYNELKYVGNEKCFKKARSRVYEILC